MSRWQKFLKSFASPVRQARKRALRERVEQLEDRTVPTGVWTQLTNTLPGGDRAQTMQLLSDGTVMVHGGAPNASSAFYKLTPNMSGTQANSYINGAFSALPSMNVSRLFYTSVVLPDGRVFVVGGEYSTPYDFTNTTEMYDPVANTWTNTASVPTPNTQVGSNPPPTPRSQFGDDPIAVMPNGQVLAGYFNSGRSYLYTPSTDTWASTGNKVGGDASDEESWVTLPDQSVLSYDVFRSDNTGVFHGQRYVPATGAWTDASNLDPVNPPQVLSSNTEGYELGPAFLLPDGRVFLFGANGHTAYYTPATDLWSAGPDIPGGNAATDDPGAMLPNGKILIAVSPHGSNPGTGYTFPNGVTVYEYDPVAQTYADVTPAGFNLANINAYKATMLMLPTGQVLMTNYSGQIDLYTPDGAPQQAWKPTISRIASSGTSFTITGTQLNGISEGAAYGDDNEMSSNYPIVRLTDTAGATKYGRTFNWAPGTVASGSTPVTAQFTDGLAPGAYLLSVSAAGITSDNVLFVQMGVGANNVTLRLKAGDATRLQVFQGGGLIAEYALNAFTGIAVCGDAGADTLTLDYSNGAFAPPAFFDYDGGGGTDTVAALRDANFILGNSALTIGGVGTVTLNSVEVANLTGGVSGNTFTVSGWTGSGTLDGQGGSDTVAATKNQNFTLTDTALTATDGMNFGLTSVEVANLTGGASNNTFTVSGWTGTGTLDGAGGSDTVVDLKNADFTLTDTSLAATAAGTLTLTSVEVATLTGGASNNTFTVSGWTGSGTLDGAGGTDTVIAAKNRDFTLADTSLSATDGMNFGLTSVEVANLTGGASNNTFTVSGWTQGGSIDGAGGSDTVAAAKDRDFTLTDASLTATDGMNFGLTSVEVANLTGGGSNNTFTVSGWTGTGTLDGAGGSDTVVDLKNADFTLTNSSLAATGAGTLALASVEVANLTGGASNNTFTVSGWTGTGTLDGAGGTDTVVDAKNVDFTLTNSSLAATGAGTLALNSVEVANLTGGASGNTFTVSGWTGTGTLNGAGGTDTVVATKDANFTLTDTSLAATDGLSITLASVEVANLTGGAGGNSFTVSGWTQGGSISGAGGTDTVIAAKDRDFTLTNALLQASDGLNLTLASIEAANLTGGASNNTFTVSGWTQGGSVDGAGGTDAVVAAKDRDFTLADTSLTATDGLSLTLASVELANLTGGASNNTFAVSGWTSGGSLSGAGGTDVVVAVKDRDFSLSDALLAASDGLALLLSSVEVANLTGGASANTFIVGGWTGTGTLDGAGGTDAVFDQKNADFVLTNTSLAATGAGTLGLLSIEVANLTGGASNNTFTVSGWTGTGTLDGAGGGDAVVAAKDANFTLTNSSLATTDGMSLALASVEAAFLTGGASANTFTVSGWTGGGSLAGGDGVDTVIAAKDRDFLLANNAVQASDGLNLTLAAVEVGNLTGGGSNNTFTVSGWTQGGGISGGDGVDAVVAAKDRDFLLGNAALQASDGLNLTLAAVEVGNLTGGTSNNTFTVSGWTQAGTIAGGDGVDAVTAAKDRDFLLANDALQSSDGLNLGLFAVEVGNLAGGGSNNTFTVSGWTQAGTLDGSGGTDTVFAAKDRDFLLAGTVLQASDGLNVNLSGFERATLIGGGSANVMTVNGWSGEVGLSGAGGDDTLVVDDRLAVPAAVTADGGTGRDTLAVIGRTADDAVTAEVTSADGGGRLAGLSAAFGFAGVEGVAFDGAGGTNALAWVDGTNRPYGTATTPEAGIVVRPLAADAGDVRLGLGGGLFPAVRFVRVNGAFSVNGDGDGSGDKDVLTVLAASTTGQQSGGWAELTVADGRDEISVSDAAVQITDAAAGGLKPVTLATTDGAVTFGTLLVRAGNEPPRFGDTVTAAPSNRLNILLDGMDPARGLPGDRLVVTAAGPRKLVRSTDPAFGPPHARVVQTADGASVGFVRFEAIDGTGLALTGTGGIVTGSGPGTPAEVRADDAAGGQRFTPLRPFGAFAGGVNVASGDVTGDGIADIVVGAGAGGAPHVKVFDGVDGSEVRSFFAYDAALTAGVSVAAGDVTGDGVADIVTGAGAGGAPHVKVFDGATGAEVRSFFAYDAALAAGVSVAAGDVDGDGYADVVTGAGAGGAPHVKAFSGRTGREIRSFFAYGPGFTGGVNVAAGDVTGDFVADIITGAGAGGGPNVKVFDGLSAATVADFMANDPFAPGGVPEVPGEGGVRVAAADLNGDGVRDILTAKGPGVRAVLRGYRIARYDAATKSFVATPLEQIFRAQVYDDSYGLGLTVGG